MEELDKPVELEIEVVDEYSPYRIARLHGRYVCSLTQDPNTYEEQMTWETSPQLSREDILKILIENYRALSENPPEGIRLEGGNIKIGYQNGEEYHHANYSLEEEGIQNLKKDRFFSKSSCLLAHGEIETPFKEGIVRIGGRIYFGIDTQCGGSWVPGNDFVVHCNWSMKLKYISPLIQQLFMQTSGLRDSFKIDGLQRLLTNTAIS